MRFRKKTVLYAAGVLACGNIALQALGFVYRVMLSRFAGAEGLGMYRLANSVYLVLHTGCLSGVTMACSRLSAACEATGEKHKTGAVLRLAFSVFFTLAFVSAAVLLLCGDRVADGILGDPRAAQAFPFMLLCLMLTGIENILKALFIGLECVQYTAISETGEQLVRIAAVGMLLYTVGGSDCGTMAKLIFAGMAVSEVFSVLLLSFLFRRERGELHRTSSKIDTVLARQFAAIAVPLSLSALATNLLSAAGSVILPRRLMVAGLEAEQALAALGTLSGMALPLMLLPAALVGSVGTALLPVVTAAHATGNRARVRALVGRGHDGRTHRHPGDCRAHSACALAQSAAVRAAAYAAVCGAHRRGGHRHVLPDDDDRPAERARSANPERSDCRSGGMCAACARVSLVRAPDARHLRLSACAAAERGRGGAAQPRFSAPRDRLCAAPDAAVWSAGDVRRGGRTLDTAVCVHVLRPHRKSCSRTRADACRGRDALPCAPAPVRPASTRLSCGAERIEMPEIRSKS